MRKYIAMMITLACLSMTACGNKEVSIDVNALGNSLNTQISYADELGLVDFEMAGRLMNLSDVNVVNSAIYLGAGASAEEIVVLECASEEDAVKAIAAMQSHIAEQREIFADYAPEEVVKLDSALVKSAGKYAVMCISGDADKAEEIFKNSLFT